MDAKNSRKNTWTVAQARAKLSEVIEKARHQGPQVITENRESAVVIVDAAQWEQMRKQDRKGNIAGFLLNSPLGGSGLKVIRLKDDWREVDL